MRGNAVSDAQDQNTADAEGRPVEPAAPDAPSPTTESGQAQAPQAPQTVQGADYGPPPPGAYPPPPAGAYPPPPGAYPPPVGAYPPPPGGYPPPQPGTYPPAGVYQPNAAAYPPPYQRPTRRGLGFAITSLVLGVGALLFSWVPFIGIIAGLAGIAAVVLGAIALARAFAGKGMSIAGLVTGGLAVILSVLLTVTWFGLFFSSINGSPSHPLATASPPPYSDGGKDTFHSTTQDGPVGFGDTVSYDNGVTVTIPAGTPYTPNDPIWSTQKVDLGYDVTVHNGSSAKITVNLIGEATAGGTDGDDILDKSLDTMTDFSLAAGATHTYHIAFSLASQSDVALSVSIAEHYDYAEFSD